MISNENAYNTGKTVGSAGAVLYGLFNIAKGAQSFLSNIKNIKDITINIPKLFSSIDDFGSVLALSPSTSYTISIPVSDIQALIQGGIGVLQTNSNLNQSQCESVTENGDSRKLINNMKNAGIEEPDYPNEAHHIVAGNSTYKSANE